MPDFYGKNIEFLKLFGQKRWGDCSPGRVTGTKMFQGGGVVVDRSSKPNHIYVADTGNSRILGFYSYESRKADLVFGQPDEFSGAPNGDCNTGVYGSATRASMCLMCTPANPNLGEQWMRLNIDVDAEGNLYVPDFYNNRVLMYRAPFKKKSAGDLTANLPDLVLGQPNFNSNGINRGKGPNDRNKRSLYLSFGGDHVSARGVSADSAGDVWVADTFNYRVLRFPKGSTEADLVLGQPNFKDSFPNSDTGRHVVRLDLMYYPVLARVNPDTGELYVVDEYPGRFGARIMVFEPPFENGMPAARLVFPRQLPKGDYAQGNYQLTHATGLVFNPVKTDDWIDEETQTHRYRDGVFWLHDSGPDGSGKRTLLLDAEGTILLAVGAPDVVTFGGKYETYGHVNQHPETPFNLIWPGGMIGFDSDHNIYLADVAFHRVARFALPYRVGRSGNYPVLPPSNGGLFAGRLPNTFGAAHCSGPGVGAITFRDQLIVRDTKRYMVWENYLSKKIDGPKADFIVGQEGGNNIDQENQIYGRAMHAIDDHDRLWMHDAQGKLMVYKLPLKPASKPLKENIRLYWVDDKEEIPYRCDQPLAFERRTRMLWVYDTEYHRLLRVKNPDEFRSKLFVDFVVGQKNKTDKLLNRGMAAPDAASFGDVNDIRFDNHGNLFVVDNTYECHHNDRIIVFLARDLPSLPVVRMFLPIQAKKIFVVERFDETHICNRDASIDRPYSPVSIAFNSRNEMVVGNDGYYYNLPTRHLTQLYLYRQPLKKQTPDAVIELPLGAPGELSFDQYDNLIVQDHIWNKVWIINYDRDPAWLRPLD